MNIFSASRLAWPRRLALPLFALLIALAACGGGGGGDSAPSAPPPAISDGVGIVSASAVPRPQVGAALTLLDVPHLQQPQSLCVPTSAAMVLQYFGDPHDPRELKTLSRSGTWDPAKSFSDYTTTSFADMLAGLRTLGYRWSESDHANDAAGFAAAAAELKSSLRQGNPVLVDTTLYGGHVFVVAGFDESQSLFYVRDPNLAPPGWRALTSAQLQAIWNSSRTGFNGRGALLAARRS